MIISQRYKSSAATQSSKNSSTSTSIARSSTSATSKISGTSIQISNAAKLLAAKIPTKTLEETLLSAKISKDFLQLPIGVTQAYADGGTRSALSNSDNVDGTYTTNGTEEVSIALMPMSASAKLPANSLEYLNRLKSATTASSFNSTLLSMKNAGISVKFGINLGDTVDIDGDNLADKNAYAALDYSYSTADGIELSPATVAPTSSDYLDASRKTPFNLVIQQDMKTLDTSEVAKINELIDKGLINEIQLGAGNSSKIDFDGPQLEKFKTIFAKLAPPTKLNFSSASVTVEQIKSLPLALYKKMEKPLVIKDEMANLTGYEAWRKVGSLANSKLIESIEISDTETINLDYDQLKGGAAILGKISGKYNISVSNVIASNANAVSLMPSVTKVNIQDSIDKVLFLGTNLQKISDLNKLGSITTASDPVSITGTVAYMKSRIGVLHALAAGEKISEITLTDRTSANFNMTSSEIAKNHAAIALIGEEEPISITNSGPVSASEAAKIEELSSTNKITISSAVQIIDTAENLIDFGLEILNLNDDDLISRITLRGEANVSQAQRLLEAIPFDDLDEFKINDTSEELKTLYPVDWTDEERTKFTEKIASIKATGAITVADIPSFSPTILSKMVSGFEIVDSIPNITDADHLIDLAAVGKLRSLVVSCSASELDDLSTLKESLREQNLFRYLSGFAIDDEYSSITSSVIGKLVALSSTGTLKSININDTMTLSEAITLFNSLKGRKLDRAVLPLKIEDIAANFLDESTTPGTPNVLLGNLGGLASIGKLESLTIEDITTGLTNLLIDRKLADYLSANLSG